MVTDCIRFLTYSLNFSVNSTIFSEDTTEVLEFPDLLQLGLIDGHMQFCWSVLLTLIFMSYAWQLSLRCSVCSWSFVLSEFIIAWSSANISSFSASESGLASFVIWSI